MRLLHMIASADLSGGGPIEAARQLAKLWSQLGASIDLMTLDPSGSVHEIDYPGDIIPLGPPQKVGPSRFYGYSPDVVAWLRANLHRYDAVINSGLWRYNARAGRVVLPNSGVPYFVFTHGMLDPWFRDTYPLKHLGKQVSWWLAEGPLLKHATNVLFTCEEELVLAQNAFWPYDVKGVSVGYGTVDVPDDVAAQRAAFYDKLPQLAQRRFLLFLSRIHEKKGCDLLVDAFAHVAQADPGLDLVIAGPDKHGMIEGLRSQAEQAGVADRIHFPGMLVGAAKYGAFRNAEAFVLTSHQENFGIVVAEALACGTPTLISDKVNIWREIIACECGLVEPDTQDGSRLLLRRWLDLPPAQRAAMGQAARACFLEHFDIQRTGRKLFDHIQAHITK